MKKLITALSNMPSYRLEEIAKKLQEMDEDSLAQGFLEFKPIDHVDVDLYTSVLSFISENSDKEIMVDQSQINASILLIGQLKAILEN